MASLGKAIEIAARVYANRVYGDDGRPYVRHCLGVMHHVSAWGDDRKCIVAVLHSALEENRVALNELESEGFAPEVIEALRIFPRRDGESVLECARRVCGNEIARAVKMVDASGPHASAN
jgi:(p)ppGpp synthase/HD superfamily hydrolase